MPNPDNIKNHKFKKGDPKINRKGRPKKIPALDTLLESIPESDYEAMIQKLMAKAKAGDVRASEVLLDRAYGKAKQTMEVKGETHISVKYDGGINDLIKPVND